MSTTILENKREYSTSAKLNWPKDSGRVMFKSP